MTIAKKHAQSYMPNGELSLEQVIQAAIDEAESLLIVGARERVRDLEWANDKLKDHAIALQERIRQLESEKVPALAEGPKHGVMLEPDDIRYIMEQASIGEAYTDDEACGIVLWIGETIDEDADAAEDRQYGLNFYNVECPEEGSICIKELPRPAAPAPRAHGGGVDCIGLALDLEKQAKTTESQTMERAMIAAAHGLRLLAATAQEKA